MKIAFQFLSIINFFLLTNTALAKETGNIKNDTLIKITVKNNKATISSNLTKEEDGYFLIKESDLSKYISITNETDEKIKAVFKSETNGKIKTMTLEGKKKSEKAFNALFGGLNDKFSLSFENSKIKFDDNGDSINQILFKKKTKTDPINTSNCSLSFIPDINKKNKGDFPNYISSDKKRGIKYRFAIDFSESFSEASLWELVENKQDSTKLYKYVRKEKISPKYLKYIALSIKNYAPQYDSIITTPSFDSYNLEGQSNFENFTNKDTAFHKNHS